MVTGGRKTWNAKAKPKTAPNPTATTPQQAEVLEHLRKGREAVQDRQLKEKLELSAAVKGKALELIEHSSRFEGAGKDVVKLFALLATNLDKATELLEEFHNSQAFDDAFKSKEQGSELRLVYETDTTDFLKRLKAEDKLNDIGGRETPAQREAQSHVRQLAESLEAHLDQAAKGKTVATFQPEGLLKASEQWNSVKPDELATHVLRAEMRKLPQDQLFKIAVGGEDLARRLVGGNSDPAKKMARLLYEAVLLEIKLEDE